MIIEAVICGYLNKALSVAAYTEEEPKPPEEYVLIEKVGGGGNDGLQRAVIAVQSYAKSMYGAAQLNEQVKEAMSLLAALPEISSCSLNSDYNYTDTETGRYRYQAVFDICHF